MTTDFTGYSKDALRYPGLDTFDTPFWYGLYSKAYQDRLPEWVMEQPEKLLARSRIVVSYKDHRNQLAEVRWPSGGKTGKTAVVKAFGSRNWTDRIRVRTREARSVRHLKNARLLLSKGIRTPEPIFLALPKLKGRRHYLAVKPLKCHRVRELLDTLRPVESMSVTLNSNRISGEQLVTACGRFIREVHDQGVVHRDMSGGNILIPDDWDGNPNGLKSIFHLVDINRMRQVGADMPIKLRIQDLEKLLIPDRYLDLYYRAYAAGCDQIQKEWPRFLRYRTAYRKMRDTPSRLWRNVLMVSTYWTRSG